MKSDMASAMKDISHYRLENTELENKLREIKKDNNDLKCSIKRYRTMFADQEKKIAELTALLEKALKGTGILTMKLGD